LLFPSTTVPAAISGVKDWSRADSAVQAGTIFAAFPKPGGRIALAAVRTEEMDKVVGRDKTAQD
jgi:hypothetical protein